MQKFNVLIEDTGEQFACAETRSLLEGMAALGRKGIPVGCRNGGCGVCRVAIVSGDFATGRMSRACVSEADEREGRVLACRTRPQSDIRLVALGPLKRAVCREAAPAPAGLTAAP